MMASELWLLWIGQERCNAVPTASARPFPQTRGLILDHEG